MRAGLLSVLFCNLLGVPPGKCQQRELFFVFVLVFLFFFCFHNFRSLKWIPLYKRMVPNFKTTTLAHSRFSLVLSNNNMA